MSNINILISILYIQAQSFAASYMSNNSDNVVAINDSTSTSTSAAVNSGSKITHSTKSDNTDTMQISQNDTDTNNSSHDDTTTTTKNDTNNISDTNNLYEYHSPECIICQSNSSNNNNTRYN